LRWVADARYTKTDSGFEKNDGDTDERCPSGCLSVSTSALEFRQKASAMQSKLPYTLSAFSDLTYTTHLVHDLFASEVAIDYQATGRYGMKRFIAELIQKPSCSLPYIALQAVAMSCFAVGNIPKGTREQTAAFRSRGAQLYSRALRQLRSALENAQSCTDPEILAAALCLHLYEVCRFPSARLI
jgi:hypothetical protein